MAEINLENAHALADRLLAIEGYRLAVSGSFFNEFVVHVPGSAERIRARLAEHGFQVEDPAGLRSLGLENALRFAVTEKRLLQEIDQLARVLEGV